MIVVDANVLAYLVLDSQFSALAEQVAEKDADWRAPRLWSSEILNVLSGYVRNDGLSIGDALLAFERSRAAIMSEVATDATAVLRLVSISRCSSFDCEYVAAAKMLDVLLVTEDKQILRSFPEVAISMSEFVAS